jgi:hypothetical protein
MVEQVIGRTHVMYEGRLVSHWFFLDQQYASLYSGEDLSGENDFGVYMSDFIGMVDIVSHIVPFESYLRWVADRDHSHLWAEIPSYRNWG